MNNIAYCGPVIAEFGWEVITIQSYYRAVCENFDKIYVCSFPEAAFLYEDFCDVFIPHKHHRCLKWWENEHLVNVQFEIPDDATFHVRPVRQYRNAARKFIPYGVKEPISTYNYLIHARNIRKGVSKNYKYEDWCEVVKMLDGSVASVGKYPDSHIPGTDDLRGVAGDVLVRYMAGARCVIGASSGVMHLAALCDVPLAVWGDKRTYFSETLEKRYTETWNPFNVPVKFVFDERWNPEPMAVIEAINEIERKEK